MNFKSSQKVFARLCKIKDFSYHSSKPASNSMPVFLFNLFQTNYSASNRFRMGKSLVFLDFLNLSIWFCYRKIFKRTCQVNYQ